MKTSNKTKMHAGKFPQRVGRREFQNGQTWAFGGRFAFSLKLVGEQFYFIVRIY